MRVVLWVAVVCIAPALSRAADEAKPGPIEIAKLERAEAVDFGREVLPILRQNCTACHNEKDAEAGLVLETAAAARKGGDSGPAVVAGDGAGSLLVRVSARLEKPFMPPRNNKAGANPLTPAELGLLKRWIDEGAKDAAAHAAPTQPGRATQPAATTRPGTPMRKAMPAGLHAIFAAAVTTDGQYAACVRANEVFVYSLPRRQLSGRVIDLALAIPGEAAGEGVAHADVVYSLAFNPDGSRLATGGDREIKLWERVESAARWSTPPTGGPRVSGLVTAPSGRIAAAGFDDGSVRLIDPADGKVTSVLGGGAAATLDDGSLKPADVADSKTSPARRGTDGAGASGDSSLKPAGPADGKATPTQPSREAAVALAFDGDMLFSVSADGLVRVWRGESRIDACRIDLTTPVVASAAVRTRAGATFLVTAGLDGSITAWACPFESAATRPTTGPAQLLAPAGEGHPASPPKHESTTPATRPADAASTRPSVVSTTVAINGETVGPPVRVVDATGSPAPSRQDATASATPAPAAVTATTPTTRPATEATTTHPASAVVATTSPATGPSTRPAATTFAGHTGAVTSLVAVPGGGGRFVSGGVDGTVRVWSVDSTESAKYFEHGGAVAAVAVSPDGARVVSVGGAVAKVFDVETDRLIATARGDRDALAASARAERAAAFAQAEVGRVTLKVAAVEQQLTASTAGVAAAEAARAAAEKAKVDREAALAVSRAATQPTDPAAVADRDAALAAGAKELDAAVATLTAAGRACDDATRHRHRVDRAFAGEKASLAVATAVAGRAAVDLENAHEAATRAEPVFKAAAFTGDGSSVVLQDSAGTVRVYGATTGLPAEVFHSPAGPATPIAVFDHSVLSAFADGSIACRNLAPQWKLSATIGTGDDRSALSGRVLSLAFSPDGTLLASGGGVPSRSGELNLWSAATGQLFGNFPDAHSDTVLGLSFSSDGTRLASGAADKFAKLWDVKTGRLVKPFEGHTGHVLSASLRHDGRSLVTGGADGTVKIWDVETGTQRATVPVSAFEVTAVSYVGISDRFLAATGQGQVRIFRDADAVAEFARDLPGPANFIQAAAVTPDGACVVTGGADGVFRANDARDGKAHSDFPPPTTAAPGPATVER